MDYKMLPGVFLLVFSVAYTTTASVAVDEVPTTTAPVPTTTESASLRSAVISDHRSDSTESANEDGTNTKSEAGDEHKKIISDNLSDLYYQTSGSKFYVSKLSKNWEEASKSCKDIGMALASITIQKEQLELFKFLFVNDLVPLDDFSGYWLSGHQLENGLYNWTSIDQPVGCWGWLPGEPSHVDDLEHCVELKHEAGSVRLGWNNFACDRKLRFICQQLSVVNKDSLPERNVTEANKELETSCYFYYYINRDRMIFDEDF